MSEMPEAGWGFEGGGENGQVSGGQCTEQWLSEGGDWCQKYEKTHKNQNWFKIS